MQQERKISFVHRQARQCAHSDLRTPALHVAKGTDYKIHRYSRLEPSWVSGSGGIGGRFFSNQIRIQEYLISILYCRHQKHLECVTLPAPSPPDGCKALSVLRTLQALPFPSCCGLGAVATLFWGCCSRFPAGLLVPPFLSSPDPSCPYVHSVPPL